MKYKLIVLGFLIANLFVVNASVINATEGVPDRGLQVSPAKLILNLKPGELEHTTINVKNYDKDLTHRVTVEVEDFYVMDGNTKAQFFVPDENHKLKARDVIDWINVEKEFTLGPNESKEVEFTITAPRDVPTGGYYGVIFFQTSESTKEDQDEQNASVQINYRVGTLLINAVQGKEPIRIEGHVNDFNVTKKFFWDSPISIFAKLYSDGNIHYKAGGEFIIKKFNKKFAIVKVDDEVMYPKVTRTFIKKIQFGIWDFGKYTAYLKMQSEDGTIKFEDSTEFYVIPWKGLAIIGGSLFGLIILSILFKKYVHIGAKPLKEKK